VRGWRRIEPPEETIMATTLATWAIDPVHSSVEFSLDYMGFSTYRTGFRELEGSLEFDAARPPRRRSPRRFRSPAST
jgi:polyisoprenoid-binding protein YceI